MKILLYLFPILLFSSFQDNTKTRIINYNGEDVKVIYQVDDKFYGTYKGRKSGYLDLKKDGSGQYKYDIFAFALPNCKPGPIPLIWGMLIDDKGEIVKFEREYGFSYPILYQSTSDNGFQGCRKKVLLDFIIEKKDGSLEISSSDDWQKKE